MGICIIEHFVHKVRCSLVSLTPLYSSDPILRYGNPTQMPTPLLDRHAGFAKTFVETFAPEILKVYVQQVELYVTQKAWLSRKVIYKIVQFLTEWYASSSTDDPRPDASITASSLNLPGRYSSPSSKPLSLSLSSHSSASVSPRRNYGEMTLSTTCESPLVILCTFWWFRRVSYLVPRR